jgi:pyridoxine 4-dehydrogenase
LVHTVDARDPPALGTETLRLGGLYTVNRLGLGTINFTGDGIWGKPRDSTRCIRVLRAAVAAGVNFVDTAHAYGPGVAEELIAKALRPYPDDLVVATKGGFSRPGPNAWRVDGRPVELGRQVDESLRRLKMDALPLWQLHRVDPAIPLEEQLGAMHEAQEQGKVRLLGLSKVTLSQLRLLEAGVQVASVQNRYNVRDRASDEIVDHCRRRGIAFVAWAPLDVGSLAVGSRATRRLAKTLNATPAQVALAWLLNRSPNVLAIPGTTSVGHLRENLRALELLGRRINEAAFSTQEDAPRRQIAAAPGRGG